jgi:hypothetical protein
VMVLVMLVMFLPLRILELRKLQSPSLLKVNLKYSFLSRV